MHIIIIISNKGLLKECNKDENVEVTRAATTSSLKRGLWNILSIVTYSPIHCQACIPVINIQSALHATPDMPKNVSHTVLLGISGNSYTVSLSSVVCICTHIFFTT
jgi:hypothetical protein